MLRRGDINYPFQFESNQRILRRDGRVERDVTAETPLYVAARYYSYAGDAFGSSLRTQRQYNFFPEPLLLFLSDGARPWSSNTCVCSSFFFCPSPQPRAAGNDAGRHAESREYFLSSLRTMGTKAYNCGFRCVLVADIC